MFTTTTIYRFFSFFFLPLKPKNKSKCIFLVIVYSYPQMILDNKNVPLVLKK